MSTPSTDWFFLRDGRQCGPVAYDELRKLAAAGGLSPADMAMNRAAERWIPASTIPGLMFSSEPTLSVTDSIARQSPAEAAWERLYEIARKQRWLNLAVAYGLAGMVVLAIGISVDLADFAWKILVVAWVVLIFLLARSLGRNPWVNALLGLIPVINLLVIASLSGQANKALQTAGIEVGFLGVALPKHPTTDQLRGVTEMLERKQAIQQSAG